MLKILNGRENLILIPKEIYRKSSGFPLYLYIWEGGGGIGMSGRLFVLTKPTNCLFVLNWIFCLISLYTLKIGDFYIFIGWPIQKKHDNLTDGDKRANEVLIFCLCLCLFHSFLSFYLNLVVNIPFGMHKLCVCCNV